MDNQKLFSITEQLNHVLYDRLNPILLGKILQEIVDNTQYHFAEEEKLMETMHYPMLAEHHDMQAVY